MDYQLAALENTAEDPRFLTSVERGFRILEALSDSLEPLSLTDLSQRTDLTVPTLQRLTSTLVEAGYLDKDDSTKRYKSTVRTVDLLYSYFARNHLAKNAWPHLMKLREELGLDVSLSIPLKSSMIYVHRLPGYAGNFENTLPGKTLPMHLSASGRCVLSLMDRSAQEQYFQSADLIALTPWSTTDRKDLISKIALCAQQGYALVQQEAVAGTMTIACPVLRQSKPVAGVSIHIPFAGTEPSGFVSKTLQRLSSICQALSSG